MDGGRRSSTEGVVQVKADNLKPVCSLDYLPEEMWNLIADKVLEGSAEDHLNLVNSCHFFQNLRASQRTTFLFEQVLPLVATALWGKEGLKGFPVKEVLKCRQVCKTWNTAIQKVVPEKFSRFGQSYVGNGRSDWRQFLKVGVAFEKIHENQYTICGWTSDDEEDGEEPEDLVNNFLRHFEQSHPPTYRSKERNPFFCSKMKLTIKDEPDLTHEHYLHGFTLMLTKYGTQVDSFYVIFNTFGGASFLERVVSLMSLWLSLLPNLKEFEFCDLGDNCLRKIRLDVDAYPLAEGRCLEKIKICSRSRPQPVFNCLVWQSKQTVCELWVEKPENHKVLFKFPFLNLKRLTLVECQRNIAHLLSSSQVPWPLETLELQDVKFVGGYAPLFQVIQDKFAKTLVSFKFVIDERLDDFDGLIWEDCKNFRLDLPKLKNIELQLGERPMCLDFLLPMKGNVEKITVSYGFEFSPTSEHVIQFAGFEERMLESNIWEIFNKLNDFNVCNSVGLYFRKDWVLKNERSGDSQE